MKQLAPQGAALDAPLVSPTGRIVTIRGGCYALELLYAAPTITVQEEFALAIHGFCSREHLPTLGSPVSQTKLSFSKGSSLGGRDFGNLGFPGVPSLSPDPYCSGKSVSLQLSLQLCVSTL